MLACTVGEVPNAALGDTILEMGFDATKGELLPSVVACLLEGVVLEAPIVAVIVLDL